MPIIFIHGVATRESDAYRKECAARNELLQQFVLEPLAEKGDRFKNIEIVNPYWGDLGATSRWNQQTLPQIHGLEQLGPEEAGTPASDLSITTTVNRLAAGGSGLERLGGSNTFVRAAQTDLVRFTEVLLSPLFLSELRLTEENEATPETEGLLQALLAKAALDVATNPEVQALVKAAKSDEEVITLLSEKVKARFAELVESKHAIPGDTSNQLEHLGPNWLDDLTNRVGEFFDRALDAPLRAAELPALEFLRGGLNQNIVTFFGDVFVYLSGRGDRENPGPIVARVLEAIHTAPRHHPEEPLLIITHSLGSTILYDLLTYYAPDLRVDVWMSVASQVGQFEEIKILKASDMHILPPEKVASLKPAVNHWFNVYDPVDVLAFKVAPVFADVDSDSEYLTGADVFKAHGEYFGRASFYRMLFDSVGGVLG